MISLAVFAALCAATLCADAVAMALAARWVGSTRGRFGPALAIAAVLSAVGLGLAAVGALVGPAGSGTATLAALSLAQWTVAFLVVRRGFRLSWGRTFAPLGALLGASLVGVAAGLWVVRPMLCEGFVLPTNSMAPTLVAADYIAAVKPSRPRRWDVVVYRATPTDVYCKRVIGLPGEVLAFDGRGGITVDGAAVAAPPVLAGRCYAAPAGAARRFSRYADGQPIHLGPHQMFLIGDNVDLSYDSRMSGPSDTSALIGVADLVYWPPAHARLLTR